MPSHPTIIPLPDELRSPRILLRPLRADDAEAVFAAIDESRDRLRPWLDWVDDHATVEDTQDYCVRRVAEWLLRTKLTLGIFAVADGRFLGRVSIRQADWALRSFELAYWVRTAVEGKGYVGEAVRLLLTLAFDQLGARRVWLRCDARNARSRRVAERLGFVLEGTLRNAGLSPTGEPRDTLVFALVPEDFARLRSLRG